MEALLPPVEHAHVLSCRLPQRSQWVSVTEVYSQQSSAMSGTVGSTQLWANSALAAREWPRPHPALLGPDFGGQRSRWPYDPF